MALSLSDGPTYCTKLPLSLSAWTRPAPPSASPCRSALRQSPAASTLTVLSAQLVSAARSGGRRPLPAMSHVPCPSLRARRAPAARHRRSPFPRSRVAASAGRRGHAHSRVDRHHDRRVQGNPPQRSGVAFALAPPGGTPARAPRARAASHRLSQRPGCGRGPALLLPLGGSVAEPGRTCAPTDRQVGRARGHLVRLPARLAAAVDRWSGRPGVRRAHSWGSRHLREARSATGTRTDVTLTRVPCRVGGLGACRLRAWLARSRRRT